MRRGSRTPPLRRTTSCAQRAGSSCQRRNPADMGDFLVKASRTEELYLVWSTVVDAPTWIFDGRNHVLKHLRDEYKRRKACPDCGRGILEEPEAKLRRVDETGTSGRDVRWYGWDDTAFIVMEGS